MVRAPLHPEPPRHGSPGEDGRGALVCPQPERRADLVCPSAALLPQTLPPGGYFSRASSVPTGAPYAVLKLANNPGGSSSDIRFSSVPLPDGTPYEIVNGSTLVRHIPQQTGLSHFRPRWYHFANRLADPGDERERPVGRRRADDCCAPQRVPRRSTRCVSARLQHRDSQPREACMRACGAGPTQRMPSSPSSGRPLRRPLRSSWRPSR